MRPLDPPPPPRSSRSRPTIAIAADTGPSRDLKPLFFIAWLLCAVFCFFQYAVRSSPGVMQPELAAAWGGNPIGAMISAYYVAYAVMALVAGMLLDRYGPRGTIPQGIAVVCVGFVLAVATWLMESKRPNSPTPSATTVAREAQLQTVAHV